MNHNQQKIESILDTLMSEHMLDSSLLEAMSVWWEALSELERMVWINKTITKTPAEAYKIFMS